jgi:ABC-type dipeptide/oligopeptide/nickel transport system permease component
MLRYAVKRVVFLLPVLVGVSVLSFTLLHLIPGDPAVIMGGSGATEGDLAGIRQEFGLDQPLPVQYIQYLSQVLRGNLGISIRSRDPVTSLIAERMQFTLVLTALSMILAVTLGVSAGVAAATHENSLFDTGTMIVAMLGLSTPGFWLGLLLLLLFAGALGWLPSGGVGTPKHLILPTLVLGAAGAGVIARMTRASMIEVLKQDYIRTLRANGLPMRRIVYTHALRNALNPVITVIGLEFGFLLGGSVLVEQVFALPGVGRLMVDSISGRDYPVVQGGLLMVAVAVVVVNLATDLVYALVNPRIRY